MHTAAARYVSVSELYSTDEVELLLDEIRDLEPTSCRGEDIQDFEIAGSGLALGGGAGAGAGSGARSPAGTERSWDSHAHYRRAPPPPPRPLAPLYCHCRQLLTLHGAAMLAIALSSLSSAICVWAGAGLQTWALPAAGRVRLLQLGGLTAGLLHAALLLLRVSSLDALLPLRWDLLGLAVHSWSGAALLGGGAGSLAALLLEPGYRPAPAHLMAPLYTAAGLGLFAACLCWTLVGLGLRSCALAARPAGAGAGAGVGSGSRRSASSRGSRSAAAYRAVPSTSRQNPL